MKRVLLPYPSQQAALDAVGSPSGVEVVAYDRNNPGAVDTHNVVFLALPNIYGKAVWPQLRDLDWSGLDVIQLGSAGFEHMVDEIPPHVGLANAAGVHDAGTSEMAIALALANLRGLDRYARDQAVHRWQAVMGESIADRRVLIFGYGRIGAAVEQRLLPFEPASIVRVARTAKTDPLVYPSTELAALLGEVDLVFVTAPATPDTVGIFNADTLAQLPAGALVVNVGRGVVIDTDAMVAEVGRLRFALDVVDPEPLPADHRLWDAPGVTIAPHVGGFFSPAQRRYDALLMQQVRRVGTGEPLLNIVKEGRDG